MQDGYLVGEYLAKYDSPEKAFEELFKVLMKHPMVMGDRGQRLAVHHLLKQECWQLELLTGFVCPRRCRHGGGL